MIVGPLRGAVAAGSAFTVEQRCHRAAEHRSGGRLVQPGVVGHAQRHVERRGGHAVGRIGGEHDPLRRHPREQLDHVEGKEAGDVIQHARVIGQARGEDPLVADRAMREDEDDPGMAQGEIDKTLRQWWKAAPGVDQNRHACRFGESEDIVHVLPVEHEVLGSRVQLDAACTVRQAALALRERFLGGIQPAERRESPIAFRRPGEHSVVGHAVGGVALGIVQRKHARPPCPGLVQGGEQLLEGERPSVLIKAEVRVGVDYFGVRRTQALDLGEERGHGIGMQIGAHTGTLFYAGRR